MTDYNCSLAELIINACAEAWRDDGELMATGLALTSAWCEPRQSKF